MFKLISFYLSFSVAKPIIAKMIEIIQNLITTVDSGQPFFKMMMYWCHLKILLPVNLNEITWTITDTASNTNNPPVIAKLFRAL